MLSKVCTEQACSLSLESMIYMQGDLCCNMMAVGHG